MPLKRKNQAMRKADKMKEEKKKGRVWLVGAGPGDGGLMTEKALAVIRLADTIVYDALISLEILSSLPQEAELIDVGKRAGKHPVPQEEINRILLEKAKEGKKILRLKGGDPFIFGRGGEELQLLAEEGIPFEVIPGVSSAAAVPAYNGIPVTHRDYTSSFHVITGHKKKNDSLDIDFEALVRLKATLVFLMGLSELETICRKLLENGMDPDTPSALLEKGCGAEQRRICTSLSNLPEAAKREKAKSPAIIVIGKVCSLEKDFAWYEKKPLFGKMILNTRPKEANADFSKRLRSLGAQVIEYPTIRTQAFASFEKEYQEMLAEERPVCLAFTSSRGVDYFFSELREKGQDLRSLLSKKDLSFAVIGEATGRALRAYGIFADYMPQSYSAGELGKLLAREWKQDGMVYLYRAEKGSQEILDVFQKKKVAYRDIPVYQTLYREKDQIGEKIYQALEEGRISAISFTSTSTVEGFVRAFRGLDYSRLLAICIGEQTAKRAAQYGFQIIISKEATMESMTKTIERELGKAPLEKDYTEE